eukprot:CAMPEP_0197647044 /NCGR_PEP_ID=MMETSP1338-20131121/24029_1 /TAXON_ID=43686 ORGANISM="Pelagodinium beii, Strain RCC1491" /NCGR_SAMPLE_ID=MMETSP1338 /ASSEMBLY_ACC=CAM_ASM_000754 /LENGTH=44 /DNA_ID= /DNA_START= /DNA_END= /DNA_ORIENTATION=
MARLAAIMCIGAYFAVGHAAKITDASTVAKAGAELEAGMACAEH